MMADAPGADAEEPSGAASDLGSQQRFSASAPPRSAREIVWSVVCVLFFRWAPNRFAGWRRGLLRCFGADVAERCFVDRSVVVRCPWNLTLDSDSVVHHNVVLDCMGPITLGRGSRISQFSHLCTRTHDYRDASMKVLSRPIVIEEFVWVAADAYVGPGVTIGARTIVGARSSVIRDLPPDVTAVGEPARPLRSRRPDGRDGDAPGN